MILYIIVLCICYGEIAKMLCLEFDFALYHTFPISCFLVYSVTALKRIGPAFIYIVLSRPWVENIVKTTVFIKEMNDFGKINEIYKKYFKEPFPARSCVEVARLPKDVLLEVEAIAWK